MACKHLAIKYGILLTDDEEDEVTAEGIRIMIIPVWKWLLRHGPVNGAHYTLT